MPKSQGDIKARNPSCVASTKPLRWLFATPATKAAIGNLDPVAGTRPLRWPFTPPIKASLPLEKPKRELPPSHSNSPLSDPCSIDAKQALRRIGPAEVTQRALGQGFEWS
jgi:hypothetical protein